MMARLPGGASLPLLVVAPGGIPATDGAVWLAPGPGCTSSVGHDPVGVLAGAGHGSRMTVAVASSDRGARRARGRAPLDDPSTRVARPCASTGHAPRPVPALRGPTHGHLARGGPPAAPAGADDVSLSMPCRWHGGCRGRFGSPGSRSGGFHSSHRRRRWVLERCGCFGWLNGKKASLRDRGKARGKTP